MDQVVYNGPNYYICNENDECEMPLKDWTAMMILSNGLVGTSLSNKKYKQFFGRFSQSS